MQENGQETNNHEFTFSGQKSFGPEFHDVGFLEDEEIAAKVNALSSPDAATAQQNSEQLLNWIAGWKGTERARTQRILDLDGAIAKALEANGNINWNTLVLLSEVEPSRPSVYGHLRLLETLEHHPDFLSPEIRQQIEQLANDGTPESQVILHKLCDFLSALAITSQFQQSTDDASDRRIKALFDNVYNFAEEQAQKSKNYLLASHWQDIAETLKGEFSRKPDKVIGVPGESSDYIISTYNEFALLQSYYNSVLAGREYFDPEQPLLTLAEGYLGQYKRGQLQKVLNEDYSQLPEVYKTDKRLVMQNEQKDNSIYLRLNNTPIQSQSWALSDFLRRLDKEDKEFYFNIINDDLDNPNNPYSRILNPQTLSPEVLARILAHNFRILHSSRQSSATAEAISDQEYLKNLFPTGKHTTAEAYLYKDMVSLQRRKKVEQDLGENLANVPPYGQAQLLKFLASRNKEEFARVISVSDSWGSRDQNPARQDFLLSFLACGEKPENGEVILTLAEKLAPELSAKIFAKYAEIVRGSEKVKESIAANFGDVNVAAEGVQAIVRDVFSKANLLLQHMGKVAPKTNDVEQLTGQMEAFRAEVALYVSMATELSKERKISLREEIEKNTVIKKSGKFTSEEISQMRKIFAFGRAEGFPAELQEQSNAEFEQKLITGNHTFYLYQPEGNIIAFLHTDPVKNHDGTIKDDAVYVGSLNLSPEGRSGALGVLFVQQLLEKNGANKDIYADVLEVNTRALNLYKRILGFKQRQDEPFSIIMAKNGKQFKNINIIRERRSGESSLTAAA